MQVPHWLQDFGGWISKPDIVEKILPTIIAGFVAAFVYWVIAHAKWISAYGFRLLNLRIRKLRTPLSRKVDLYRSTLDQQMFRIQHPWMKDGQTLNDILVPVVIASDQLAGGIEEWSLVLGQIFREHESSGHSEAPRIVIIGGPGAGKSVALKVAARDAWSLPRFNGAETLIPTFLTFGDYRRHNFELVTALCMSFESRGFSPTSDKDGENINEFVEKNLHAGQLLIAVDGLDELKEEDRKRAGNDLAADLQRFSKCPAIISCRTAAWHGQFTQIQHELIEMADFTPAAIQQFIRQWTFQAPKSNHELLDTIERQSHIAELARSPLMLTIIAFLYSQPKYHLPENRALFYDVCSRALLEEWDQARNPDRANRFERHHKEYVLCELAYRHLCGPNPEADLDERTTLQIIADVMEKYSLKKEENGKMFAELRENSGLLVRLPPIGLRFPHQTFLEFFAALHLSRHGSQEQIFEHYQVDPRRWRETLLLYIGLCESTADVSKAISRLKAEGSLDLTLAALADARTVEPGLAETILTQSELLLQSAIIGNEEWHDVVGLVTRLGHVASNERTIHSERAVRILRALLDSATQHKESVTPLAIEALLLASLRRPTEQTSRFVVEHIDELQLGSILPQMADRAFVLSAKIIGAPELTVEKKLEWIDGLRRAQGVKPLLDLATRQSLPAVLSDACVVALVRLSSTSAFKRFIEEWPNGEDSGQAASDSVWKRWGWPFPDPVHASARRLMVHLAYRVSECATPLDRQVAMQCDPRLIYLASCLGREAKRPDTLLRNPAFDATRVRTLLAIWHSAKSRRWSSWIENDYGLIVSIGAIAISVIVLWVLLLWAVFSEYRGVRVAYVNIPAVAALFTHVVCGIIVLSVYKCYGIVVDKWFGMIAAGCLFTFVAPCVVVANAFKSDRASRRALLILMLCESVVGVIIAVCISNDAYIRAYVVFVAMSQILLVMYCRSDKATHPLLANNETRVVSKMMLNGVDAK